MALVKACKHARGLTGARRLRAWRNCGCSWYARIEGAYRPLGTDFHAAADEHDRLTGQLAPSPPNRLFGAVADRWERVTEQRVTTGTMEGYLDALSYAQEWLGDIDVGAVTSGMLAEMEADLIARSKLAPLYARNCRGVAVSVLGHAADIGLIASVPRTRRRKANRDARARPRRFLSDAELAAALRVPDELAAAFRVVAMTGMRASEILALQPGDLVNGQLRIRRALSRQHGVVPYLKSNAGWRQIDVASELADLLPAHVERCWGVSYTTALTHWHDVLETAGVERCGLHALRHTNASIRIRLGQDLVYIADQLGHADPSITLREYGHLLNSEPRDASALAAAMPPGPLPSPEK